MWAGFPVLSKLARRASSATKARLCSAGIHLVGAAWMQPGCKHHVVLQTASMLLTAHAVLTHTLPSIACRGRAAVQDTLPHSNTERSLEAATSGCHLPLACPVLNSNAADSPCLPLACPATPTMPSVWPGFLVGGYPGWLRHALVAGGSAGVHLPRAGTLPSPNKAVHGAGPQQGGGAGKGTDLVGL